MENIETECSDKGSVTSEYDVQNKSDDTPAQLCPVHGNKPPDVDIVAADLAIVGSSQPPRYVNEDPPAVETALPDAHINADTYSAQLLRTMLLIIL